MRALIACAMVLVACDGDADGEPSGSGAGANGSGGSSGTQQGPGAGAGGSGGSGVGGGMGFASEYPGDVGIESHEAVIFVEAFEEPDIGTLAARWDSIDTDELSFGTDVPGGAPSASQSLGMAVPGGAGVTGVTLFKNVPDQQGTVHVRYHVKYDAVSDYHHAGMWIGGFNPPTPYAQGTAGIRPNGGDFFQNAWEPHSTGNTLSMDHYAQWPGMDCFMEPGGCWGNVFLEQSEPTIAADTWGCFELMLRLNTPGMSDGEYAVWMDDVLLQHLAPGTPSLERLGNGVWRPGPNGTPFPGFDWRSTGDLAFNWIWLDFYVDSGPSGMRWDQVVVATERIGCMTPAR